MNDLETIADKLEQFAVERDWNRFHTPKNLVMALSVEAGELMEEFQWLTEEEIRTLTDESRARITDECADVLNYLVRLSSKLGIDLIAAAHAKIVKNAEKYPVEKAKGSARKYTDL